MRVRNHIDVGVAIQERRRSLGMTQQVLAEESGVSRPWLVAVEAGHQRAELWKVLRVLWALDLDIDVSPAEPSGDDEGLVDLDALLDRHVAHRGEDDA